MFESSSKPARPVRRISLGVILSGLLLVGAVAIGLSACGAAASQRDGADVAPVAAGGSDELTASDASLRVSSASPTERPVTVHVVGAVNTPGVLTLPQGSRVAEAIASAGGATPSADLSQLNLARILGDGEQVRVPVAGEVVQPEQQASGAATPGAPVNLNTATREQLEMLPRVGPAMAQRIIDYRTEHKGFRSVDELRNVTGVGDKTFEALAVLVTV